jgi:hypothetical protein
VNDLRAGKQIDKRAALCQERHRTALEDERQRTASQHR